MREGRLNRLADILAVLGEGLLIGRGHLYGTLLYHASIMLVTKLKFKAGRFPWKSDVFPANIDLRP